MLSLPEELLLLALKEQEGTVVHAASMALSYGLAGGILLELFSLDKIEFQDKYLRIADAVRTGDPILDEAMDLMDQAGKAFGAQHWVETFARKIKHLKERLLDRLIEKGILRREEHKILWVFTAKHYPAQDLRPETELRTRVHAAVLEGVEPDDRTRSLLVLVHACNLVGELFEKPQRKAATENLKRIAEDSPVGKAIADTLLAIQLAINAAVMNAVIASAVTTHR